MNDSPAAAVLALGVSLLAIILAIIAAGVSDDMGSLVCVVLVGLWLVWLVAHPNAFRPVTQALGG